MYSPTLLEEMPPQLPAPRYSTIVGPTSLAIEPIRETLYAALADVLASTPDLHAQLTRDPPRAYYGSVAIAILAVCARSVSASAQPDTNEEGVWLVCGRRLTVTECPAPLRLLMREFVTSGLEAERIEEEDTEAAIALAQQGPAVPVPRLERARILVEHGAGYDVRDSEG